MGKFYKQFFSEGIHKLKPRYIDQAEDYLERAFSDDVSATVILPMMRQKAVTQPLSIHQNGIA